MRAPASVQTTRDTLRARLDTLGRRASTLGAVLDTVRALVEEIEEPDVSLRFETFARMATSISVELVFRWPRPDALDATPERLRVCFDALAGPQTREVELGSRDYPHIAAFVTAALEASELDASAPVSKVRIVPDSA